MKLLKVLFKNKKDKSYLKEAKELLSISSFKSLYKLFMHGKVYFAYNYINVPKGMIADHAFPQMYITKERNQKYLNEIHRLNEELKDNFLIKSFLSFSERANDFIVKKYCNRIIGYEMVKKAIILMLISDGINILVAGNKDEKAKDLMIDCVRDIYSDCVYGRGNEFLGLKYEEGKFHSGLIGKAHGKVLCLKDFEDLSESDTEYLKTAIEKKAIFFSEGEDIYSEDADFKLLAIAGTREQRFVSNSPDILNQQIPVDKDLQKMFNLRFICRNIKRDLSGIKDIVTNDSIVESIAKIPEKDEMNENEYMRRYMSYAQHFDVNFNELLNDHIVNFSEKLDSLYDQRKFIAKPDKAEVVKTVFRLAIANARLSMRKNVLIEDLVEAEKIVTYSFLIN